MEYLFLKSPIISKFSPKYPRICPVSFSRGLNFILSMDEIILFIKLLPHCYFISKNAKNAKFFFFIISKNEYLDVFQVNLNRDSLIGFVEVLSYDELEFTEQNVDPCLFYHEGAFSDSINLSSLTLCKVCSLYFKENTFINDNNGISHSHFSQHFNKSYGKVIKRLFQCGISVDKYRLLDAKSIYSRRNYIRIFKEFDSRSPMGKLTCSLTGHLQIIFHQQNSGLKIDDKGIQSLVWVPKWCPDVVSSFDFIEMDCTFSIAQPYVLFIPTMIKNNLSFPIGFVVSPTESWKTYELFYDFAEKIYPQLSVVLSNMPVLSDMGKGIKKFCTKRNLKQFFCIRHLINAIGASSPLGKISSKLLMAPTHEEFSKMFPDLIDLAIKYMQNGKTEIGNHSLFNQIFGIKD